MIKLRRTSKWEPPKFLDSLLLSPLDFLVSTLHHILLFLRGSPLKRSALRTPIRIVCLSDSHSNIVTVPSGDLLLHAGDLTNSGTAEDIQKQIDWLNSLPGFKYKIFIAGNHDSWFDDRSRKDVDRGHAKKGLDFKSLIYLQNESKSLKFDGGRMLNVYGAGDIPRCGGDDNAFQYDRHSSPWKNRIPISTDILITHTPPQHHLDIGLGCDGLLEEIWRVKPKLHVCGHVHSGHGREALYWDEAQRVYERFMSRESKGIIVDFLPGAAWLDAIKVIMYGIRGIFWQYLMVRLKDTTGSLLVNAALIYQSTSKIGNPVEVVDI